MSPLFEREKPIFYEAGRYVRSGTVIAYDSYQKTHALICIENGIGQPIPDDRTGRHYVDDAGIFGYEKDEKALLLHQITGSTEIVGNEQEAFQRTIQVLQAKGINAKDAELRKY